MTDPCVITSAYSLLTDGALGDGSTDDTAAIRLTIARAGTNGVLLAPPGKNFRVTESIGLMQGQTLLGFGATLTAAITAGDGTSHAAIYNVGYDTEAAYGAASDITVEGLTIDASLGNGIAFAHGSGFVIRDVRFTGWYHHMIDLAGVKDSRVERCWGTNTNKGVSTGSGIQVDQAITGAGSLKVDGSTLWCYNDNTVSTDVDIVGNTIAANPQSHGIHLHRTGHRGIRIIGNQVAGCLRGIFLDHTMDDGETIAAHDDVTIEGNVITDTAHIGILARGDLDGLRISGNRIEGVTVYHAIEVDPYAAVRLRITDNVLNEFDDTGIRVKKATDFVVSRNEIHQDDTDGGPRGITILDSDDGVVADNVIDLDGTTTGLGVWITREDEGTATDVAITGNRIRNVYHGIRVDCDAVGLDIIGNIISDVDQRAIFLGVGTDPLSYTADHITIAQNRIKTFALSAISVENLSDSIISGNHLRNATRDDGSQGGRGIRIAGTGSRNTVVGNAVHGIAGTAGFGILIDPTITHTTHAANVVTGFLKGISINLGEAPTGIVLVGNVLRDNVTEDNDIDTNPATMVANDIEEEEATPPALSPFSLGRTSGPQELYGTGDPDGVVTAPVGSTFRRTNGGTGSTLYVKESGTGNTGWAAK